MNFNEIKRQGKIQIERQGKTQINLLQVKVKQLQDQKIVIMTAYKNIIRLKTLSEHLLVTALVQSLPNSNFCSDANFLLSEVSFKIFFGIGNICHTLLFLSFCHLFQIKSLFPKQTSHIILLLKLLQNTHEMYQIMLDSHSKFDYAYTNNKNVTNWEKYKLYSRSLHYHVDLRQVGAII